MDETMFSGVVTEIYKQSINLMGKAYDELIPRIANACQRQDGTQIANDKQFLMLLGGPDVGKSTFLRKVGLEALKEGNRSFAHKSVPVFLELKRFTEDAIDIKTLITE